MMDLIDVRVFLQAAESRSFSAAARHFGLPPSSVSRRIRALEDQLGVPLFVRNTRYISLTEAGQAYAQGANKIIESIAEAQRSVDHFRDTPRGKLTVLSKVTLGSRLIAPLIPSFLEQHPEISVDLHLTNQPIPTLPEGYDLAIRFGLAPPSELLTRRIGTIRQSLHASPGYLERHGVPRTPEDLRDHNCLGYVTNDEPAIWRFGSAEACREFRVAGSFRSNDVNALLTATRAGMGISVFHNFLTSEDVAQGGLVRLMNEQAVTTLSSFDTSIYLIFAENMKEVLKLRLFTAHLAENLKLNE